MNTQAKTKYQEAEQLAAKLQSHLAKLYPDSHPTVEINIHRVPHHTYQQIKTANQDQLKETKSKHTSNKYLLPQKDPQTHHLTYFLNNQ